jgi:hypothetical protein
MDARFRRLDRIMLVVDGGSGAGQIVDLVGLDIERKSHIVPDHLEAMMVEHSFDVAPCTGKIIVDADDISALLEQAFAQVRAEKSGAAGD